MKFLLASFFFVCMAFGGYGSDPFCAGFEAGYVAGYCYGKNYCIEPLTPLCPLPRLGEETYMDGYNRGFLVGLNKQR